MNELPAWKATATPGLYRYTPNGRYYSRFAIKGRRSFRSLKTTAYAVATVKHAHLIARVAEARQGLSHSDEVRTMGDLRKVYASRVATSLQKEATKVNCMLWLDRLVKNWPGFDEVAPNSITLETVLRFRERLLGTKFKLMHSRATRTGYKPAVVNQTLSALKILLQLAKEHHLIFATPFDDQKAFGARIWLPKKSRRPVLPSRFDMEQVFEMMKTVHGADRFDAGRVAFLQGQALDASEHARFLAFSGARLNEGNAVRWEDIGADSIQINGTKSATSVRPVPIVGAMRGLLDEIRRRRVDSGAPLRGPVLNVKGCRDALRRACARVGVKTLTHHDLRHYFATVCIESGVDIPTVSNWLGHADGGALLMQVYAHLRNAHAARMAQQVTFSPVSSAVA